MLKINKCVLRALHDDILFQFEDADTTIFNGKTKVVGFQEKTAWGFVYKDSLKSIDSARWGVVVSVGPDVDPDIYPGRRILIEKLKWTNGVEFDGVVYWKTNNDQIIALDSSED